MDGPAPEGGSERQVRMAKYYSTNALYEYIQQQELTQFRFAKENIWIMLYGTGESVPKLLLVISAVRGEDYRGRCLTQHEQEIMELAGVLAGRSGLPYRVVRYRLGGGAAGRGSVHRLLERSVRRTSHRPSAAAVCTKWPAGYPGGDG